MASSSGVNVVIDMHEIEREIESSNSSAETTGIRKSEKTPKQAGGQDCLQILIEEELHVLPKKPNNSAPFTIFRASGFMRKEKKEMYEPIMVSIGPYYHGREELRTMEEYKRWCLRDFLRRNTKVILEDYLKEMRKLERQARQCYSESTKMSSDQFVLMLLLDGCFILEFCLKARDEESDTFFSTHFSEIVSDLTLFENQIPFFVIHKLSSILSDPVNNTRCIDKCYLLDALFECFPNNTETEYPEISCDAVDHLLHFLYKCMVPEFVVEQINSQCTQPLSMKSKLFSWLKSWLPEESREYSPLDVFPCATVLHELGVTFRCKKNPHSKFDITFDDGILEMPISEIWDATNIILENILAFEKSQHIPMIFTSYAYLMDSLVDTENDIALLRQSGIIQSYVESDEVAATIFNRIGRGACLDTNYFETLFKQVIIYSNSTWPKYRARLMHDYFSNPWTSISVFAGVMLLGLTVTQTYYTIFSAYHH